MTNFMHSFTEWRTIRGTKWNCRGLHNYWTYHNFSTTDGLLNHKLVWKQFFVRYCKKALSLHSRADFRELPALVDTEMDCFVYFSVGDSVETVQWFFLSTILPAMSQHWITSLTLFRGWWVVFKATLIEHCGCTRFTHILLAYCTSHIAYSVERPTV